MKPPRRRITIVSVLVLVWLVTAWGFSWNESEVIVGEWREVRPHIREIGLPANAVTGSPSQYHFQREEPGSFALPFKPVTEYGGLPVREGVAFSLWTRRLEFSSNRTFTLGDERGVFQIGRWELTPGTVYKITTRSLDPSWPDRYTFYLDEDSTEDLAEFPASDRAEPCPYARAYRLNGVPSPVVVVGTELRVTGEWSPFHKDEPITWKTRFDRQVRVWLGMPVSPLPFPGTPSTP